MIKYLLTDKDKQSYSLIVATDSNNYQMSLEEKSKFSNKNNNYISLNFNSLKLENPSEVYSFFNIIKNKEILNFEIYYLVEDKDYNVFDLSDYNNLQIVKITYDKRMIAAEKNEEGKNDFIEKIIFFLE